MHIAKHSYRLLWLWQDFLTTVDYQKNRALGNNIRKNHLFVTGGLIGSAVALSWRGVGVIQKTIIQFFKQFLFLRSVFN